MHVGWLRMDMSWLRQPDKVHLMDQPLITKMDLITLKRRAKMNFESSNNIALLAASINLHVLRCPEHKPETGKCDFYTTSAEVTLEQASKNIGKTIRKWTTKIEKLCEKHSLTPLELADAFNEISVALSSIYRKNANASTAVIEALTSPLTKIGVIDSPRIEKEELED